MTDDNSYQDGSGKVFLVGVDLKAQSCGWTRNKPPILSREVPTVQLDSANPWKGFSSSKTKKSDMGVDSEFRGKMPF